MFVDSFSGVRDFLTGGVDTLSPLEVAARALLIYATAIVLVRAGESRFMGKNTAFDVILGIILGSVLSRAINGGAGFWETAAAGSILVALHFILAALSYHFDFVSLIVKGRGRVLVRDGVIQWDEMRRNHIGREDLMSALRTNGGVEDVSEVRLARFERDGSISVLPNAKRAPRVLDVKVEDGVQTVRIVIE